MKNKITKIFLWLRRNQKYGEKDFPQDVLNLGPGGYVSDKAVNVEGASFYLYLGLPSLIRQIVKNVIRLLDNSLFQKIRKKELQYKGCTTILHDFQYGIPFKDKTFRYIYTSHMLEHFSKSEAKELLYECKRVLKDDGVLRIVVPDLEQFVEQYLRGSKESLIGAFITEVRLPDGGGYVSPTQIHV